MNYALLLALSLFACLGAKGQTDMKLLAGCYTEKDPKGLSLYSFNPENGQLTFISRSDAGPNPSYLCISQKTGMVYAANEVSDFRGQKGGGVTSLRYDPERREFIKTGELVLPDGSPCYISLSPDEKFLLLANYTGGSVNVVELDDKGIPSRITGLITYGEPGKSSHPHMIRFDPRGKFVYLTDLGLDRINVYSFDQENGHLQPVKDGITRLPQGSGPRHFDFSADGKIMYVICELNSSMNVFSVGSDGKLTLIQNCSTLAEDYMKESFCADIHLSNDGKSLYGSNRGENTVVTFSCDTDGKINLAGHTACGGNWPRNFVIDPSGSFLLTANQRSGNISVLKIDPGTGIPATTELNYPLSSPACLKFLRL
jgi:6-phosphogluconolactonase